MHEPIKAVPAEARRQIGRREFFLPSEAIQGKDLPPDVGIAQIWKVPWSNPKLPVFPTLGFQPK